MIFNFKDLKLDQWAGVHFRRDLPPHPELSVSVRPGALCSEPSLIPHLSQGRANMVLTP